MTHLLLVTVEDPWDVRSWSGIPCSLRAALERRLPKVTSFRPAGPRRTLAAALLRLFFGARRNPLWISNPTLRSNARQLRREILRTRPDAVFSISSQAIVLLGPVDVPVFLFSDAPYLTFSETYAPWETAPRALSRFAAQEAAAARRIEGLCFGSAWACAEAARLYGLRDVGTSHRLRVTPLGANWTPSVSREAVLNHAQNRSFDRMDLLFVGRDWERKGGPLALEIAHQLHRAGHPVMLHIVGCRPPLDPATAAFVTVYGLLRRDVASENLRLEALFLSSHFLLVPTRAECFGIAFAEAQAFALPPVSRAIHALPSVVVDGQTGLLLPPEAPAHVYVERLLNLFQDPDAYRAMAHRARSRFESLLNWDHTAKLLVEAMEASLHPRTAATEGPLQERNPFRESRVSS
jgi:glycosyltransferase involved in cell wall biosynthesis